MEFDIKRDGNGVDWRAVAQLLEKVGMAHYEPDVHQRAFEASHTTVFIYQTDRLIGFGRAISDGAYQAAVYDCAVDPACQGRGVGKLIMHNITAALPDCNIILYAMPGKEGFYHRLGFRKLKTGMAFFRNSESMQARGFTE